MIFVNDWINPNRGSDKAWMKIEVLVQANAAQLSNFASTDQFRFREAFIEVGNVLALNRSADFWTGERYYRRLNITINDWRFPTSEARSKTSSPTTALMPRTILMRDFMA